ncbi:MAG: glycosyltransferase family 4 protein [Dehalococcoidia bacterium]|nr:glycosyltransferase family 4 protein [Dehalococcoidia bacterium]
MRVTHIIALYREGLGYEENHLGHFQTLKGADVSLITSMLPSGMWQQTSDTALLDAEDNLAPYEDRDVHIHRLNARFRARANSQVVLRGLKDALHRIRPDILHIHGPVGALCVQALLIARSLDIPAVVDNHLCYFNLRIYDLKKRVYYRSLFRRGILPLLDGVVGRYIPLMPDSEAVLHNELGIAYDRMTHSTLGADTETFKYSEDERDSVRRKLNVPSDVPVIAFLGRIGLEKNVDLLVSAWNHLADKYGAHLLLIGPATNAMEQSLLALVEDHHRDRLTVTGHISNSELPAYLSAADIGVWPGDPGIAMIEAMSCSLAIVHTNPYYIARMSIYENAELFPRGDAVALARTIDSILEDPNKLARMRRQSRRLAEDIFDWRIVAARTNAIYEEVIAGKMSTMPAIWESGGTDGRTLTQVAPRG